MIKKVEGIIVSTVDYKENSKMINILTRDEGLIGVLARGCKRLKSNISVVCNPLLHGLFYLNSRDNVHYTLIEVDILDGYRLIKKDILKLNYCLYLLELSSQVYRHDNNLNIYSVLVSGLKKIEMGYAPEAINIIIELKMLEYLGIKPRIDSCVGCGSTKDIITISSYRGGYLCRKCVSSEKIVNIKTVRLIRMLFYVDLEHIKKLEISTNIKKELNDFLSDYYDRYSGLCLKSKVFLDNYIKMLTV